MQYGKRMDTKTVTANCYEEYYKTKLSNRNDPLSNPEVLFQGFAFESSVTNALRATQLPPDTARVLDVGCGSGNSLLNFIKLGFKAENLYGIDILEERVETGISKFPNLKLSVGDATDLKFSTGSFDIVFESTMFLQITDDNLACRIGTEMIRVTKPGGFIVLVDWRYGKPGKSEFSAVNSERISKLFSVNKATCVFASYKGALIPPVGRFLSANLPSTYFLVQALFPFLTGQMTTVLQKL
jgi:ubiquinone/menaquinone biosynthesis C-methylase UbiE